MKIPRRVIDAYAKALDKCKGAAGKRVGDALKAFAASTPSASVAEIRDFAIAALVKAVGDYGGASASLACTLFDDIMEAENAAVIPASPANPVDEESIERGVRYQAGKLSDGDPEGFTTECGELAKYHVLRAANRTIALSVERNRGGDIRYARIPRGATTCEWCLMLASRGIDYLTAQTAAAGGHRHCDCMLVPGVHGRTKVGGYDPDAYKTMWKKISIVNRSSLPPEQKEAIKTAWYESTATPGMKRLPSSQVSEIYDAGMKSAWAEFRKSATPECYDRTVNVYLDELGSAWGMNLSGSSLVTKSNSLMFAHPAKDELWAVSKMSGNVEEVVFQAEDPERHGNPDLTIDGRYADIKTPGNFRKAKHLMAKAARQCEAVGKERGCCVLSLLNYREEVDELAEKAQSFVSDGTFEKVLLVSRRECIVLKDERP